MNDLEVFSTLKSLTAHYADDPFLNRSTITTTTTTSTFAPPTFAPSSTFVYNVSNIVHSFAKAVVNNTIAAVNNTIAADQTIANTQTIANNNIIDINKSIGDIDVFNNIDAFSNITTNATVNDTGIESIEQIYHEIHELVSIIVPIFFGIIAVTGFFGNFLVILVVLFNKQMRSTTNLLIMNLAVADLLFVVFCVPFTATDYVTDIWPFGNLWCSIVQYLIVVTAFASIYTLVLMSIDRFLAVVHPIRSRSLRTEEITKKAIVALWVVILTVSLPVPMSHGVLYEYDGDNNLVFAQCQFMQNEFVSLSAYQIIFLVSSYLLPLMVISGLYVRMIMRLWHQGSGVRMSVESQRGRKRVTRLVVVVVIAFASLWLPVQLILILKALDLYHANSKFKVILQIVAQTLAYTSSCINPLLYAFLSDNFRKAFHKAFRYSPLYQHYSSDLPPPRRTSCARTSTTGL